MKKFYNTLGSFCYNHTERRYKEGCYDYFRHERKRCEIHLNVKDSHKKIQYLFLFILKS